MNGELNVSEQIVDFEYDKECQDSPFRSAVDECIERGILGDFLREHRDEVVGILEEEYIIEKYFERLDKAEEVIEAHKNGMPGIDIQKHFGMTVEQAKEILTAE